MNKNSEKLREYINKLNLNNYFVQKKGFSNG